jgi:alkylation response protein AidB-like acyl-CoA dehydrogenase
VSLAGIDRVSGTEAVNPLLDAGHIELAARIAHVCDTYLANRPEPATDDEARDEARALLGLMGEAELYDPVGTLDLRALCLVREKVAAANTLADAVLALQALGGTPLVLAGTDAQRAQWLDGILSGRTMAAFAMTEPEAGSDVAGMRTTARREGETWVLDGTKHLISNAGIADLYVVFAVTRARAGSRGISAFLVEAGTPGVVFEGAQRLAAPHPLGRVRFDRCRVPEEALLGERDRGFHLGMATLDHIRPTVGAAACGMAARALIEALRHATTRHQFGEPLAGFQLVREKLGRMATDLEAARLLVYRAAWEKDRHADRITLEAAMAKSFATEAAQRIVDEAVQIAGGAGVVVGHPVERLYRAVRALRIYEGTTEIQRLVIAGELLRPTTPAPSGSAATAMREGG